MIASWKRADTTQVIKDSDVRLISLSQSDAWLDRRLDVSLRLVEDDIPRSDFNQVICWTETPISLLNKSSKDVVHIVIHLVPISKLLRLPFHRTNSVVAAFEQPTLSLCIMSQKIIRMIHLRRSHSKIRMTSISVSRLHTWCLADTFW